MNKNKNKSHVLYIKGVEAFEKYKIPNVELMETKKFTDKQLANIAKGDMFLLSRQYNQKLWKMLKKIYAKQFKIVSIWIDSSIANLSFELFDKKQNIHTFKFHTEDSVLDFKVFKTKKEIGRGNVTPFFFVDSFTGPGSYSGRGIMRSSQFENMFTAAREFGNRYAEANGDCSELLNPEVGKKDSDNGCLKDRPGRVKYVEEDTNKEPIIDVNYDKSKIDKDECTFKFNVGGFTEKDCSLSELADKIDEVKEGDNISAEIKIAHNQLEMNLINKIAEILNSDYRVSSSLVANDKVAMILHEVEHYKFQKDFDGDRVNVLSINPRNPEITKANEIIVGNTYILNGSNDIGIDAEIRPYIGKKVVVTKLHKNGLFSIMCNKEGEEKVFNGIAKYNLTPLLKEDSDSMENFDSVAPEKSTLGKILAKNMLDGIEKLKNNSDVKDDDKRVNYTPECSIPLADKEMASKTVEEVSEYLDNAEYDIIISNIKRSISIKYMTEKIAGKHNIILPKDFRERLCDLSYLPDLQNRFKQFNNIGILQQELLLKSEDKDILEGIGELTFAQVLELFTVLADMKGMIKIKDEESGEYCLKHLEKKAELIVNDIKVADITDIKISKMGVLLLTPEDNSVGEFGRDSKNCTWELFANLEEAIDKLKKTNTEEKVYTLLKYQSRASTVFSNIVPRISKASFGNVFAVLLDADTLFYYRNKLNPNVEEIGLSCKPINLKKEHNVRLRNKYWAHLAIEITEEDIKTKISIQPYIKKTKTVDIEKQVLVDEDEYLKVINFINSNVPAERLSCNIIFYRYDIIVPKDFKERITSLLGMVDYKNKFKFISDPHQCLIGILYLTTSDTDIAHHQLGKLTFEELLELFTILADVSTDTPVGLDELNVNSQAQDRTKRARPTNMKVEVYPATVSVEEGEVNPLANEDDIFKCPGMPKFKNEFTGVGIIAAVEDNLDAKEEENNELVLIVCPKEKDTYNIICKTKNELETDKSLSNYRVKFINSNTVLFNLIKNDLLNAQHTLNLTREQINGVTKVYVPSHTVGLFYKITEDDSNNHTVDIVFSYSQYSFNKFNNKVENRYYIAFQDFQDECTK